MVSYHVKKGEDIVVISGTQRGKRGKVLEVLKSKNRVRIEGINMMKKAVKKSPKHPEGGLIEKEGSIHISNVMSAAKYDEKRAKKAKV